MFKGTTPTFIITFPKSIVADDIRRLVVTCTQKGAQVFEWGEEYTGTWQTFSHETGTQVFKKTLTQTETTSESLKPDVDLEVQIRIRTKDDKALASKIMRIKVCDVLKAGVI